MPTQRVGPTHHPRQERLVDYASGSLPEPMALLVATHLALCPLCRLALVELEAMGGALLEELTPEPVADDSLARLLARIDRPAPAADPVADAPPLPGQPLLPKPLRDYIGSLDQVTWRHLGPLSEARLLPDFDNFTTRLLRANPGTALPHHTHVGSELTLVLQGSFSDVTGHYLRGDVCDADSRVDHRPVADQDEACVCLVVTDAPLRLTGWLGRLLNPFIRI